MKRRPREDKTRAIPFRNSFKNQSEELGIILSGGGSRAAYQVGALKALAPYFANNGHQISIVIGSSIGAVNGLVFSAALKKGFLEAVYLMEELWLERNFRNTFRGSPSRVFFNAIRIASIQYASPGPSPTSRSIFDPAPLMERLDGIISECGGLSPENRAPYLKSVGVMTTVEGAERKPLLFLSTHSRLSEDVMQGASFEIYYVEDLTAKHGFASAALPSILPPVEINADGETIRLVDGGISQNVPVDPAARIGAEKVIVVDISGRSWWLDHYGEAHDTRPTWEVPAGEKTFCVRPPDTLIIKPQSGLGPILKRAVSSSRARFLRSVGPIWPLFKILKNKMGEDLAYEVMSYVALDNDYIHALIESGYEETRALLMNKADLEFQHNVSFEGIVEKVVA